MGPEEIYISRVQLQNKYEYITKEKLGPIPYAARKFSADQILLTILSLRVLSINNVWIDKLGKIKKLVNFSC